MPTTVDDSALLAALAAFRLLPDKARKETAAAVRTTLTPLWRNIVGTRVRYAEGSVAERQDLIAGPGSARFTASGAGALAAYKRKVELSGGLSTTSWWAVEFGTTQPGYSGTRLPRRYPQGRIVYRGVRSWAPAAQRVYLGVLADVLRSTGVVEDED